MVTSFNLVYSSAAAARMLGIVYQQKIIVREWFSVVWVWVRGYRPKFMSKSAFKNHFVQWRKAAARALHVSHWAENIYLTVNGTKGSQYLVQTHQDSVRCECEDYQNQVKFLGRGCCKHGYAVLSALGYGSLQDYLAVQ